MRGGSSGRASVLLLATACTAPVARTPDASPALDASRDVAPLDAVTARDAPVPPATDAPDASPGCGDGVCGDDENCEACPSDCGACTGCRDETIALGGVAQTLTNCSNADTAVIADVLAHTDAAAEGWFHAGDRFVANSQSVAWIDTRTAPGILRGFWQVDRAGHDVGYREPTIPGNPIKSLVQIHAGFNSVDDPYGYKGLHVEVWQTMGGRYFTYANGHPGDVAETTLSTQRSWSHYAATLVDSSNGSPDYTGVSGAHAHLVWNVAYTVTPGTFRIDTSLGATADVDFTGDSGGLLLLTNQACRAVAGSGGHFAPCDPAAVAARSLHVVQADGAGASPGVEPLGGDAFDALGTTAIGWTEDRTVVRLADQRSGSPSAVLAGPRWTLRPAAGSPVTLVVRAFWSSDDPAAQSFAYGNALHYNSRPEDLGGVSGQASLDTIFQPPRPANGFAADGALAVGPSRGALHFAVDLTRP